MKIPTAAITNDFAFGDGSEDFWEEDFDIDVSNETEEGDTQIRTSRGVNYTTYVKADTPNQERRQLIVKATLFAIIFVPSIVYAFHRLKAMYCSASWLSPFPKFCDHTHVC